MAYAAAFDLLDERGVRLEDLARLVQDLQKPYDPGLSLETCRAAVEAVIKKREVQYAVITGVTLDRMAEAGTLDEPLGSIVREDSPLFAVRQVLALGIVNIYGSIGLSNFGYLAEERPDFLGEFDEQPGRVNTFLVSLLAAIVAAACARIAHNPSRKRD